MIGRNGKQEDPTDDQDAISLKCILDRVEAAAEWTLRIFSAATSSSGASWANPSCARSPDVEDVMRLLGAVGKPAAETSRRSIRELAPSSAQDWRASLRDAGVNADAPTKSTACFSRMRSLAPPASLAATVEIPTTWHSRRHRHTPTMRTLPSAIEKLESLDEIAEKVRKCTRCPLYKTATKAVPGRRRSEGELVCVGEAPGANEDETGRPFVGAAGKLLTKILAAIDLSREEVFICNVLKHRPPGNRNPLPEEIEACSPYLIRQLELIKPKVIVAFGPLRRRLFSTPRRPSESSVGTSIGTMAFRSSSPITPRRCSAIRRGNAPLGKMSSSPVEFSIAPLGA